MVLRAATVYVLSVSLCALLLFFAVLVCSAQQGQPVKPTCEQQLATALNQLQQSVSARFEGETFLRAQYEQQIAALHAQQTKPVEPQPKEEGK